MIDSALYCTEYISWAVELRFYTANFYTIVRSVRADVRILTQIVQWCDYTSET